MIILTALSTFVFQLSLCFFCYSKKTRTDQTLGVSIKAMMNEMMENTKPYMKIL
jgi:hypothetical protein